MTTEKHTRRSRGSLIAGVLFILTGILIFTLKPGEPGSSEPREAALPQGPAAPPPAQDTPGFTGTAVLRDALGIEISSLQLSVGGTRIDMRYKIVDSGKAMALTNKMFRAMLITASGKSLSLPSTPSGSPLRQDSGSQLVAGRTYANLFPNTGNLVKSGDTVTLQIGKLRADNLVVH